MKVQVTEVLEPHYIERGYMKGWWVSHKTHDGRLVLHTGRYFKTYEAIERYLKQLVSDGRGTAIQPPRTPRCAARFVGIS